MEGAQKVIAVADSKAIPKEIIERLKAEGHEVYILTAEESGLQVAVKKPGRAEYRRFKDQRVDPGKRTVATENLFLACLLHPSKEEFQKILADAPALADAFGETILDKLGGAEEASVKKA